MMNIYLIRHGQTDWNIQGRIQGSHDIPLNETGLMQAQMLAEGMESKPVKKIFSSTLKRALATAEALSSRQQAEIIPMPQLIEMEFGKWEGLTWEEIEEKYPKEYRHWVLNPSEAAPPGGESQDQIIKRCMEVLHIIVEQTGGREDIAVVSHGGILAWLVSVMLGPDVQEESIIVENASITTVHYSPLTEIFTVLERNDTSHIKKGKLI
ncbi:histidine phosphatase family protein [Lacrimispora amygdalina]|jgi:broad specificity phosphatase PhoE|uniref:histidine phosphatase family protein n=1 Tax=Lacrimispora TaxID=2719231 RepID=UPI002E8E5441|nr:histidine phosphatase family protein [Lacrimispora amygdalina]